jgi:hypothetical protein
LALNTILQSEFLKEFEEATMAAGQASSGVFNDSKTKRVNAKKRARTYQKDHF